MGLAAACALAVARAKRVSVSNRILSLYLHHILFTPHFLPLLKIYRLHIATNDPAHLLEAVFQLQPTIDVAEQFPAFSIESEGNQPQSHYSSVDFEVGHIFQFGAVNSGDFSQCIEVKNALADI